MSVEVELKARLVDPQAVRKHLHALAPGVVEVYQDTYFEPASAQFAADGYELRIRTIESAKGMCHLLVFKEPAVHASGSKPEHEITVDDAHTTARILTGLGFRPVLAFTKQCVNYRVGHGGWHLLATVVTMPEVDGTFLEVEALAELADVDDALTAVRGLLGELGVTDAELTRETYTDAVRAARAG